MNRGRQPTTLLYTVTMNRQLYRRPRWIEDGNGVFEYFLFFLNYYVVSKASMNRGRQHLFLTATEITFGIVMLYRRPRWIEDGNTTLLYFCITNLHVPLYRRPRWIEDGNFSGSSGSPIIFPYFTVVSKASMNRGRQLEVKTNEFMVCKK